MRETLRFLGQCATNLRTTGAVMPSGRYLARKMVASLGTIHPEEVIVELGPGTGVFTRELRKQFPGHRIIAIEFNPSFVARLRQMMPDVTVVEGCASKLRQHLDEHDIPIEKVGAVLSGLPLLSLPKDLGQAIFTAIGEILRPGQRYVQFTYSKRMWKRFQPHGFRFDQSSKVWLNFPPAFVLPFTRIASSDVTVSAAV